MRPCPGNCPDNLKTAERICLPHSSPFSPCCLDFVSPCSKEAAALSLPKDFQKTSPYSKASVQGLHFHVLIHHIAKQTSTKGVCQWTKHRRVYLLTQISLLKAAYGSHQLKIQPPPMFNRRTLNTDHCHARVHHPSQVIDVCLRSRSYRDTAPIRNTLLTPTEPRHRPFQETASTLPSAPVETTLHDFNARSGSKSHVHSTTSCRRPQTYPGPVSSLESMGYQSTPKSPSTSDVGSDQKPGLNHWKSGPGKSTPWPLQSLRMHLGRLQINKCP